MENLNISAKCMPAAAAAAAKSLQSCPTLCDLTDSSPPGSSSLEFSRQEHWSGLPFPSPMHESEKWNWSRSVVSDSSWPHGLQPTRLFLPWDFPGNSTGVGFHCLLQPNALMIVKLLRVVNRLLTSLSANIHQIRCRMISVIVPLSFICLQIRFLVLIK